MTSPVKKGTPASHFSLFFFSFFFSPKKQKTEHQSESNCKILVLNPMESLSMLCCLDKGRLFLSSSQLQSCLREIAE
jgi:hypothetical protein